MRTRKYEASKRGEREDETTIERTKKEQSRKWGGWSTPVSRDSRTLKKRNERKERCEEDRGREMRPEKGKCTEMLHENSTVALQETSICKFHGLFLFSIALRERETGKKSGTLRRWTFREEYATTRIYVHQGIGYIILSKLIVRKIAIVLMAKHEHRRKLENYFINYKILACNKVESFISTEIDVEI